MQTLKPVKLVYNRPLTFRKRKSEQFSDGEKKRYTSNSQKLIGSKILDKNIQTYRMWFLFLKLALELEEQGAVLVIKRSNEKGSKKSNKIVKKIRVKRDRYVGWDLDQVLKCHFNDWWGSHRHLFLDEGIKILQEGDTIGSEPGYLYVKINTNRRIRDIYSSLRSHIEKSRRHKSESRYKVMGNPRPLVLQNRYNALILKLEGMPDKEILDRKKKYLRISDGRIVNGYSTAHSSRIMFGLISGNERVFGAKQILLSVCDGYFVRNPHDNYLS